MSNAGRFGYRSKIVSILMVMVFAGGCACKTNPQPNIFVPQEGDLLFQSLDGNSFVDAINKVTQGYRGANLAHVGIVAHNNDGRIVVLEAVSRGVVATPLDAFLGRSLDRIGNPRVLAGRLKPKYRHLVPPAIDEAWSLEGKPYDKVFDIHNDAYYCSELVYRSFLVANAGEPLFELQPMTFVDPNTGETFEAWEMYFADLDVPVPEGEPGINPGGISRSEVLDIIHVYGLPDGWEHLR